MMCNFCRKEYDDAFLFCPWCGKPKDETRKKKRGNGTGSVYRSGSSWTAEATQGYWTDEDGNLHRVRKKKSGFKTKREALDYLQELSGTPGDRRFTMKDLWEQYERTSLRKLSDHRQVAYKTIFNRMKDIHYKYIDQLTVADLQEAIESVGSTFYPQRDAKSIISHLYKLAMSQQAVTQNLAPFLVLPELKETSTDPWTEDEILAFWQAWNDGDRFAGIILLMIYTGMRPGEIRSVTKNMIDLEAGTITGAGSKTKKGKQTPIVLAGSIVPVVQKLMETPDMLLCPGSKETFYREYYKTLDQLDVRQLPPYSCRHTTATALALSNTSLPIMKEIMRHTRLSTTQRYIHVGTDDMRKAVNDAMG